ncbi:NifB/NifX family molybdenum-iron cluster-binding protein [Candidatus Methylobacter oryzae]|uniref:Nitrogen fixation protein n=1 Tax=Candidatus Methylobacter oryzae TaxID=2497749 RepID=A0ABY3C4H4_9GAMM|nr:NifB/NifX family molybdenum-iron cluster-binding protein [Candidatus Methylobacter oryzae]TRW89614.1 nitrogen fixation protein [Candidatus Methylobacter oryzae]
MSKPGHVKIALTSNSLTKVDCAFALAKQIVFYDVSYSSSEFIDVVRFSGGDAGEHKGSAKNGGTCWMEDEALNAGGDRITPRVEAVKDCHVVFTKGLSDVAAVKLRDADVFPVKMEAGRDIDEVIAYLQRMMNGRPPLWLRKAMGGPRNSDYLLDKDSEDVSEDGAVREPIAIENVQSNEAHQVPSSPA